jgi:hypothetical protein
MTIPAIDRGGLKGSEASWIPHCLEKRLTDGGELVSLTQQPRFKLGHNLVCISVRGSVMPMDIMRLNGLGKLKRFNNFSRTPTHDHSTGNMARQADKLAFAPKS